MQQSSTPGLPDFVAEQIRALRLAADRPLIAVDADEVLFYFMRGLEDWLDAQGLYFSWASFALFGNIRSRDGDEPVPADQLKGLLDGFFASHTASLTPVEGAAEALARLSAKAEIVVLSNLPITAKPDREKALARAGMPYPLVANTGPKGPALAAMIGSISRPTVFIDDIPHNHASVAEEVPHSHRLHFIADPRLAKLLAPSRHCHARPVDWPELETHILRHLET